MVSPPLAVAPPATDLPTPTPSVFAPKDKGKAPVITPMRRNILLLTERGKTQENLMADAIHAAPVVDTYQHFPKLKRLRKQFQEESGNGSIFSGVEEFLKSFSLRHVILESWEKTSVEMEVTLVMIFQRKESNKP